MTNSTAYKIGGTSGAVANGYFVAPRLVKLELDIADVAATVTTGGYAELMTIPANSFFRFIGAKSVTTVSTDASASRVDIGDEDDDDQFVTNQSTVTADTVYTRASGGEYHTDGEYTGAAGSLRIKLTGDKMAGGTANASGIIQVVFLLGDGSRVAQMTTQS